MKVLITGATGFVGRHLIRRLIKDKIDTCAVVRPTTNKEFLEKLNVKYYIDNGDTSALIEYINNEQFDGIIHLASLFISEHSYKDIEPLVVSNVLFPTRVLEAGVVSQIKWFINTGTFWQHYQNKDYSPVNLYAATKQAFEDIAQYYMETSDVVFVTIRLNDTFGYDDTRPKLFNLWKRIADTGEEIDMSPGEQIMDIMYIDDVIDAYIKLIELLNSEYAQKYKGKVFAVTSDERITLKEFARLFEETTNKKLNINWGRKSYRKREVMYPWDKGERVPGWIQKVSLREGILKALEG
jgi:nucleoside-diphosphate-sugar epimerase